MVPGDELMADGSFAMERGDVLLPSDVSGSDVIRLGPEDQMQFAEAVLREPEAIPALARALESRRKLFGEAGTVSQASGEVRPVWDVIVDNMAEVHLEEFAKLPEDRARQVDHYLYGHRKR
jgi:hypothetical protein